MKRISTSNLLTPDITRAFTLLGEGQVRFVGGCVRNAVLGAPQTDIDIATPLPPTDVMRVLTAAGFKVVPTGLDHGTVTAVLDGKGVEITTLRRDLSTDGRRAIVSFTDNWADDAARRDFTINALYADASGKIYDPLGTGLTDLERRKIRFIGNAEERIQEDYLRILRFFRFYGSYGKGAADKTALAACIKFSPKIVTLSRERVTQEFTKILMGNRADKILTLMRDSHILPKIIGKNFDAKHFVSIMKLEKTIETNASHILFPARLLMLAGGTGYLPKSFYSNLIINKKTDSILKVVAKIKIDIKRLDTLELQKLLYKFPWESVALALLTTAVKGTIPPKEFAKIWAFFLETKRPVFPISGKDILAQGIPAGVEVGKILKRLETRWIKSGFTLAREDLL